MKAKKVLSIIFNSINMVLMLALMACGVCAVMQTTNAIKGVDLINILANYFGEISNGLIVGVSSFGVSVGKINRLVFDIIPLAIVFLSFLFSLIILIKVSKNKRCLFSLIYKVVVEGLALIILGYIIYVRLSNGMKINTFLMVIACEAIVVLSLVFNFITMSGLPEKESSNRKQTPSIQSNTNAGINQGVQLNGGISQVNSFTSPVQNSSFLSQNQTGGYSSPNVNQTSFEQTNISQQNSFDANNINAYSSSNTNLSESSGLFNSSTQTQVEPIDVSANQNINSNVNPSFNSNYGQADSFNQTNNQTGLNSFGQTAQSGYFAQNFASNQSDLGSSTLGNSTISSGYQAESGVTPNQTNMNPSYGSTGYSQPEGFTTQNPSQINSSTDLNQPFSSQTSFGNGYDIDKPATFESNNNIENNTSQFDAYQSQTVQPNFDNISQPTVSADEFSIPSINQNNTNGVAINVQNSNPYDTDNNGNNN